VSLLQLDLTDYVSRLRTRTATSREFVEIATFFTHLRDVSESPLPSSAFANAAYTAMLDAEELAFDKDWPILDFSVLFTLSFKTGVFYRQMFRQQDMLGKEAIREKFPKANLSGVISDEHIPIYHFMMEVRRDQLLNDTINVIRKTRSAVFARKMLVRFRGEEGEDIGGVSREFFHLLMSQLFSRDYGMFRIVNGSYYWFDVSSDEDILYQTLGTVVALAVYNQIMLPIRFPLLFYKKMLGRPLGMHDLSELEPGLVQSFRQLLHMRSRGESVSAAFLTFTGIIDRYGTLVTEELVPNGDLMDVTNDNVDEYISLYCSWYMTTSIERQFKGFRTGFERIFSREWLGNFTPDELDIMVSGEAVLAWEELQNKAKYSDGYRRTSKEVLWFWEIFQELNEEDKCRFLQFTTGSDRAPIGGLASVELTIQRIADPSKLPVSHTCFYVLGLPEYEAKETMKEKLMIALTHTEGFGLR
jgi:ubiquitin-protein ligase E3 A